MVIYDLGPKHAMRIRVKNETVIYIQTIQGTNQPTTAASPLATTATATPLKTTAATLLLA